MALPSRRFLVFWVFLAMFELHPRTASAAESLWAHDNLFAWTVSTFDTVARTPEERGAMLKRLGFGGYAYEGTKADVPDFDREIAAMKKNGIALVGWSFDTDPADPLAKAVLDAIKRNDVHPWLIFKPLPESLPRTPEEFTQFFPPGMKLPSGKEYYNDLSDSDRKAFRAGLEKIYAKDLPQTPEEQRARLEKSVQRVKALADIAAAYGCKVALYNHNGWFGMVDNELAIIQRLAEMGVTNVGMLYNFNHARDTLHDDTKDFPALWARMKDHALGVTITGIKRSDGSLAYPGEGVAEREMMRTIETSGWRGWIGLTAEGAGPADVRLEKSLIGLDWLAAELRKPGSGGKRPFPLAE